MELNSTVSSPIEFHVEELNPTSRWIHETALRRAKKYLASEAELLESIIQVDRDKTYQKFGLTHLSPYCVKYLGLSEDVAGNFVRVARKSMQVPQLKEAIDEGRISVNKAKTIASVLTLHNQENWIEKAETLTKDKLEREVAKVSPHAQKPEKAKPQGPDRVRVEFELSHDDMDLFRRAQELASQKLGRSANLAETQKLLLESYLDRNDPVRKADRAKNRPPVPDGSETDRDGSSSSVIPAAVANSVRRRDRGCCQAKMPDGSICRSRKWVHFHHIVARANGGLHSLDNIITLCSAHHRLWHEQR